MKRSKLVTSPSSPLRSISSGSLRKSLGFVEGLSLVFGTIIGAGIFSSPGVVFRNAQSPGASLVIWALAGLVAYCGTLSYVELACVLPSAGGEVAYLTRIYGRRVGFLFSWGSATVTRPSALAIEVMVCAQYVLQVLYSFQPQTPQPFSLSFAMDVELLASLMLACIFVINAMNWSTSILKLASIMSLVSLSCAIFSGLVYSFEQGIQQISFHNSSSNIADFSAAFLAASFSYDGWNSLNYAIEELSSPSDFLPIVNTALPLVTGLFVFVNASYLTVLSPSIVSTSEAIGVDLASEVIGPLAGRFMPIFVACSTFGSAVGNVFSASRLVHHASAHDKTLPQYLGVLQNSQPLHAGFCQCLIGVLFLTVIGDFEDLMGIFACAMWLFYIANCMGVIILRHTEPHVERSYRVPLAAPILFVLVSSTVLCIEFFVNPTNAAASIGLV